MEERTQIDGSGEIYEARKPEDKGFQNKLNLALDVARTGGEILKDVGGRWGSKLTQEVTKQAQKWIQERKRMTTDDNNFVNLMTVIFQHSRSAMYSVFTMFMALLPIFMIFIHVFYYMIDRSASLITMRRKDGLWYKLAFVAVELIVLFVVLKFIVTSIFMPILSMQLTIISRISEMASLGFIETMRDQLALFQEGRGIPRGEYSFVTLMAGIVTMIGRSVHSLISLMLVLAPIVEITLHLLRFVLETLVRLKETKDLNTFVKKLLIFVIQLIVALILVVFAFSSILYPIFCIGFNVGLRFLSIMAGKGLI